MYDYYLARFGRKSYNDRDAVIEAAEFRSPDPNRPDIKQENTASFNTSTFRLLFGKGDGITFAPLGNAFDVVAHEYAHAVTRSATGILSTGDATAINEAYSDIFAASAEAWRDGFVSDDTWKIAEDVFTPLTPSDALRYLGEPAKDFGGNTRDFYPERYITMGDPGESRDNAGIANLAFFLLVNGGTHPRNKTRMNVEAIGLDRAEQIFYRAIAMRYVAGATNFIALRNATGRAAGDLYGLDFADKVYSAWCAVGLEACPNNNATFRNQLQIIAGGQPFTGQRIDLIVTMMNTGTTPWTRDRGYRLANISPGDNMRFGWSRIEHGDGLTAPGLTHTFRMTITAPDMPGVYALQTQMVREDGAVPQFFGEPSPVVMLEVLSRPGS